MVLLLPPKSRAETPRRIPRPAGYLLIFCASPTRHGLYDLDLFAGTGVLDNMSDEDDALVAGVGALKASVMRLYGVVVIFSGWLRWVRGRLLCGHEVPLRGPCPGVCHHRRGVFLPTLAILG
jgi:hypothetical protein